MRAVLQPFGRAIWTRWKGSDRDGRREAVGGRPRASYGAPLRKTGLKGTAERLKNVGASGGLKESFEEKTGIFKRPAVFVRQAFAYPGMAFLAHAAQRKKSVPAWVWENALEAYASKNRSVLRQGRRMRMNLRGALPSVASHTP